MPPLNERHVLRVETCLPEDRPKLVSVPVMHYRIRSEVQLESPRVRA